MNELRVNGDRFWQSLMVMAKIGATDKGGVCRLALSSEDLKARNLFSDWCKALGMEVRFDAMGNQFARYAGKSANAKPILIGSHLDSQPTGGKYDGVLGVLAGLEAVRTLHEAGEKPDHPIELVNWTNEEGARFAPAMIGSGVYAGAFELEEAHAITDADGISIKEALTKNGQLGEGLTRTDYHASLELHIEQGPVLEQNEKTIGVVTGVQGMRWYECHVEGKPAHAGTTPMEMRNDPIKRATALIQRCYELVKADPEAKITIGVLQAYPGSINTVPERVTFNIDLRHPDEAALNMLEENISAIIKTWNVIKPGLALEAIWRSPAIHFHPACIDAIDSACHGLGIASQKLMSGAGHDSVYINRMTPTGMIFIPCKDGLSHNEAESIEKEHAVAGANVLLQSLLQLDQTDDIPL